MAILAFGGWEAGNQYELGSGTGTWSLSSAQSRTGTYSIRCNPTTSAVGAAYVRPLGTSGVRTGNFDVATLYTSFYFRIATLPATEEEFYVVLDTGGSYKAYLTVTSAGYIKAYSNAGSLGGTGSTALSTNTWYRIDVKSSTGSGNTSFQVRINGTIELDISINQLTNNNGYVRLGKNTNINSNSVDYYFDDVVVCSDAFIGDYEIKRLAPNANGSTMSWTSGTSPYDYSCIDEVPVSYSDYLDCGTGSGDKIALFGFQSCADAGIAGTIYAINTFAIAGESISGTSSNKHRILSGSSTQNSAAGYNYSTTAALTQMLSLTDPATSAAWTTSGLDSIEAGLVEANAINVRLSQFCISVLYAPPTGTSAQTSDEATQSASGTVGSSETTGTSAQVADETSQAASGTLTNAGTSGQVGDESQQSAAGTITNTGTSAQASDEASQASAGIVSYEGLAAQSLDEVSQAAAGSLLYTGALAQVSDETTQSASGELAYTGASAQVLDESLQSASGNLTNAGSSTQTLDEVTQSAAGEVESAGLSGSIAQAGAEAQQSASGELNYIGALVQVGDETTQSAAGSLLYTGALAQDADESSQAASGALTAEGAVGQSLDEATQAISATLTVAGTIAQLSDEASQSANDLIIYPLFVHAVSARVNSHRVAAREFICVVDKTYTINAGGRYVSS